MSITACITIISQQPINGTNFRLQEATGVTINFGIRTGKACIPGAAINDPAPAIHNTPDISSSSYNFNIHFLIALDISDTASPRDEAFCISDNFKFAYSATL